jgi:cytochrome c oxidase assembly protein subunit 15
VTFTKAWIEMIHRYLAMTVGVLILVMAVSSWVDWLTHRRRARSAGPAATAPPVSPWWPTVTLVWVIVQGLFGKYTVTLKLYPAVVTAHLLGGMALLALLVAQHEAWRGRTLRLAPGLWAAAAAVTALLWVQIALGGWVSTNYAVLACSGFPQCNGQWWPSMDFAHGFTVLRELGRTGGGSFIPMEALVAIHFVHRVVALGLFAALLALAAALHRQGDPGSRRSAAWLLALALWQVVSGLSNVVLGWPLAAALAHSAGAAALVAVTTSLLARASAGRRAENAGGGEAVTVGLASPSPEPSNPRPSAVPVR